MEDKDAMFGVLAAVLHIGNVTFTMVDVSNNSLQIIIMTALQLIVKTTAEIAHINYACYSNNILAL